jgi:3-hydroxyacyl-[acyl-carrier-protein] dehydratase
MRFVLIDRLLELEPGRRAVATMCFADAHDVFADHFPGMPIVPGVLLTEAMGQTGGWLLAATLGFESWPLLVMISSAKFRRLVRPDETLHLTASIRSGGSETFEIDAEARSGGHRVADARLVFRTFTFTLDDANRDQFRTWAKETFDRLGGAALIRIS